ncbi:hypothetical protein AGMMS50256_33700 [Betaproteobacteria bacterium]|nr:hypothetical protein AGMMS50256_33700 [Betaproteobacteria bacterium]
MKFCDKPFREIYVDSGGQIHFCPWMNSKPIGYITEGLETVWNGEAAQKIRRSILDSSYRYCRKDVCPFLTNDDLPNVSGKTLEEATLPFPDRFNLAYDYQCNLSCPSCRPKPIIRVWPEVLGMFEKAYQELAPHLNNLRHLSITGHGDPFFSKDCMRILENLHPERTGAEIFLETNGTCFVPKVWKRIEHLAKFHIIMRVSIDSFNPHVYAKLRRGGNFAQLQKNLRFMSELRHSGHIKRLESVMVVQDLNFMEIPAFAETCFNLGVDSVHLENIYSWGTMDEKTYFEKDLLNPRHPQHEFFNELRDEVLKDPRVHCWAGKTNRIPVEFFVTGQSRLAISEIAETDIVDEHVDFSALLTAVRNRDYIFVVGGQGIYRGMLTYREVIKSIKNEQAILMQAGELCHFGHVVAETDLARILSKKDSFLADSDMQPVTPIVAADGKLIAKLLVSH